MKLLVMDNGGGGDGVDLALRALEAGHQVKYWLPPGAPPAGDGMLEKPEDWEPEMDWAELIVLTHNDKYLAPLTPYFGAGYPIFGTNPKAAELEHDRGLGQAVLEAAGVDIVPYHTVDSIDEAIELVKSTGEAYAIKPAGDESNKALTCVARDADEAIFMLTRWKEQGLSGQLMLQEKVDGVEMGIAAWFGPGGFSASLEESFEHKKFMNDDLGCNTGEMGTVLRNVSKSKLFEEVLEPVGDYLHEVNYVGNVSVNCIVPKRGSPRPLEFTMRLGWPAFCLYQAIIQGDPVEWMAELLHGRDTLEVSTDVVVGVLLAHGDFPTDHETEGTFAGFPISGLKSSNWGNFHFQQAMTGTASGMTAPQILTAGNYVMVVSGCGITVSQAAEAAYEVAWDIKIPSNLMFRTDIGKRLEKDLPIVQRQGYAKGMRY